MNEIALLKKQAAEFAVDQYIQSGMVVGLGEGSTANYAIQYLAQKLKAGHLQNIVAIPCSKRVEAMAREISIPLTTLDEHPVIDVTIDGADEVDPQFNVIKGGGGALLHEKIVAQASREEIIVVDEQKQVPVLGTGWALPIEVIAFGWGAQEAFLKSIGGQPVLRRKEDGSPYITDEGNYIIDCNFGQMHQPYELAAKLDSRAGIVEHGLFLGLATRVIVAGGSGIRELNR